MVFSSFDIFSPNKEAKKLADLLKISSGFEIAEIGAGKGSASFYLAKVVGPNGFIFTTEFDENKLKKINKALKKNQIPNMQTALASASNPNLPNTQFDIIFMSKVYHHFTCSAEQNASYNNHLKPGGLLAIIDFDPKWYLKLSTPKGIPKSYGGHGIWKQTLIKEVETAGFKLKQLIDNFSWGGLYCVIFSKY